MIEGRGSLERGTLSVTSPTPDVYPYYNLDTLTLAGAEDTADRVMLLRHALTAGAKSYEAERRYSETVTYLRISRMIGFWYQGL